ncbi:extensin family protein [Novosphingobium sp. KCTC 2891]|uniref:extensin family protein n=1 Tax=Novosphingobium sp. KCTC 2891 TaxID=2989730 RepID=UPI002222CAFC|nr:extensin family protein [Novosphingobium sp. KCTC 2891]MCW1382506.1 extensin family protein [Novosphingobium sp. KCTC 2891]
MKWPALPLLLTATLAAALAGCVDAPEPARRGPSRTSLGTMTQRPDARACLANLGRSDAAFTPLPDQYFGAGCSTLNVVRLNYLRSDDSRLQLSNLGPVTCPLASALSGWARFGVDRAARQILGSPLARIETMGSYSCRTVAGTSRMSAHATADAIDIGGFLLADGRRINVLRDWDSDSPQIRAFLRTVRDSGCKRFATVLSPEYNPAHRDHLHLEVGQGRPFCR